MFTPIVTKKREQVINFKLLKLSNATYRHRSISELNLLNLETSMHSVIEISHVEYFTNLRQRRQQRMFFAYIDFSVNEVSLIFDKF